MRHGLVADLFRADLHPDVGHGVLGREGNIRGPAVGRVSVNQCDAVRLMDRGAEILVSQVEERLHQGAFHLRKGKLEQLG